MKSDLTTSSTTYSSTAVVHVVLSKNVTAKKSIENARICVRWDGAATEVFQGLQQPERCDGAPNFASAHNTKVGVQAAHQRQVGRRK